MNSKEPVDNHEDKHGRFLRIAERRTRMVLRALRVLGNCANKAAYEYTDDEITKIFNAIDEDLKQVRQRFRPRRADEFRLRGTSSEAKS